MTSREDALEEIADIAQLHALSIDDIGKALSNAQTTDTSTRSTGILSKVLAYLGGIFVLAGIALFITMQWDGFSSPVRVFITLGTGFCIYLFALATTTDERFAKVSTPMFLAAALLQPTGIVVMMNEYSRGGKPEHGLLFMCVVMFIQQFCTFLARREQTNLLFISLFFGSAGFGTLCDILNIDIEIVALVTGASLLCISYVIDKSIHKPITPFWYFVGAGFFLYGAFDCIEGSILEILFFGIAAGIMYLGTVVRSRTLLFVSVLALTSFTGYFFRGVLMNAFGLILMGVLLIALSAFAMRLNRKYIQQH